MVTALSMNPFLLLLLRRSVIGIVISAAPPNHIIIVEVETSPMPKATLGIVASFILVSPPSTPTVLTLIRLSLLFLLSFSIPLHFAVFVTVLILMVTPPRRWRLMLPSLSSPPAAIILAVVFVRIVTISLTMLRPGPLVAAVLRVFQQAAAEYTLNKAKPRAFAFENVCNLLDDSLHDLSSFADATALDAPCSFLVGTASGIPLLPLSSPPGVAWAVKGAALGVKAVWKFFNCTGIAARVGGR